MKHKFVAIFVLAMLLVGVLSGCAPGASQVTTVAGGTRGYSEGKGAEAQFDSPGAIVPGPDGSLYVADYNNGAVRKIAPDGTVSTLATSDCCFVSGIAMNDDNALAIGEWPNGGGRISLAGMDGMLKESAGSLNMGSEDGKGSAASFRGPFSIAIDKNGNIYVADRDNYRIRKITLDGTVITFAGSAENDLVIGYQDGPAAEAQFNKPTGVAVDSSGNLYVADTNNHCIRKITPDGTVSTLAGSPTPGFADGKGKLAQFNLPYGVAVDKDGNVYVADTANHRIRKITPDGTVTTLAGNGQPGNADGPAAQAQFRMPQALAVDGKGVIYVADTENNAIRKITP